MIEGREISFRGHTEEQDEIPGLTYKNPLKHARVERILDHCASLKLEGAENLDQVLSLIEERKKVIAIGNHRSMIDAPVLDRAIEINGYGDISNKLVFLLGQKVKRMLVSDYFSDAYPHIDVWPETLIPEGEEVKIARTMTRNSSRAVRDQLERGNIVTIFGEGTRSRTGELGQFSPTIGHFAKEPDTFIVPFALIGTETIVPPTKNLPKFSTILKINHPYAQVRIGEPFEAAEFMEGEGKERYKTLMEHTRKCVDALIPPEDKIPYCNREE